jgi:2-methylcitrate dehydratase PrpD
MISDAQKLFVFFIDLSYDALPYEMVKQTRRLILDALSCCCLGASESQGRQLLQGIGQIAKDTGPCSIMGASWTTDPLYAGLINGCLAQVHDGNDGIVDAERLQVCCHPGRLVVPAALACAQFIHCTGRQLITAVASAYEMAYRMRRLKSPTRDMYAPVFAAAKLMELNRHQLENAMIQGIFTAPGHTGFAWPLGDEYFLANGKMTRNGIESALLAKHKMQSSSWSDRPVLFEAYLDDLGRDWGVDHMYLKPYPVCRNIHATLDCVRMIQQQHNIQVQLIASVDVYRHHGDYVGKERLGTDASRMACQLNIYYAVAWALLEGTVLPEHFSDEARSRPDIEQLSRKVHLYMQSDANITRDWPADRTRVCIVLTDGKRYERQIDYPTGESEKSMNDEQCREKFTAWSAAVFTPQQQHDLYHSVMQLESLNDVAALIPVISTKQCLRGV